MMQWASSDRQWEDGLFHRALETMKKPGRREHARDDAVNEK